MVTLASVAAIVSTMLLSLVFLITKLPAPAFTPSSNLSTRLALTATLVPLSAGELLARVGAVVSVTSAPMLIQLPWNCCSAAGKSLETTLLPGQMVSPLSCNSCTKVPWAVLKTSTIVSKLPPVTSRRTSRFTFNSVAGLLVPSQRKRRKSLVTSVLAEPEGPARIR